MWSQILKWALLKSMMTSVHFCLLVILVILVADTESQQNESVPLDDELNTSQREIYPGVGFPAMFPIWKGLKVRKCESGRFKELKINEWWTHYFTNASAPDRSEFEKLYTFFLLAQSDYAAYEHAMDEELCLGQITLNECKGTSCGCRAKTKEFMYNEKENTGPVPYESSKPFGVVCLIARDEPCAKMTNPRDYKTYKKTRIRCEPDYCCKFQWDTGKSICQSCYTSAATTLAPKFNLYTTATVVVTLWLIIFTLPALPLLSE